MVRLEVSDEAKKQPGMNGQNNQALNTEQVHT